MAPRWHLPSGKLLLGQYRSHLSTSNWKESFIGNMTAFIAWEGSLVDYGSAMLNMNHRLISQKVRCLADAEKSNVLIENAEPNSIVFVTAAPLPLPYQVRMEFSILSTTSHLDVNQATTARNSQSEQVIEHGPDEVDSSSDHHVNDSAGASANRATTGLVPVSEAKVSISTSTDLVPDVPKSQWSEDQPGDDDRLEKMEKVPTMVQPTIKPVVYHNHPKVITGHGRKPGSITTTMPRVPSVRRETPAYFVELTEESAMKYNTMRNNNFDQTNQPNRSQAVTKHSRNITERIYKRFVTRPPLPGPVSPIIPKVNFIPVDNPHGGKLIGGLAITLIVIIVFLVLLSDIPYAMRWCPYFKRNCTDGWYRCAGQQPPKKRGARVARDRFSVEALCDASSIHLLRRHTRLQSSYTLGEHDNDAHSMSVHSNLESEP